MLWAFIFVSYSVIYIDCHNYKSGFCDGCKNEYTRIKRAKYFPSSPFKFYNHPPFSPAIRGPFSYTPPPGYTNNDVGPPISSNPRPYKVSKRPTSDGLGDEDINNLIKYLSKKDLDKIVHIANEKERLSERYRETNDKNNYEYSPDFSNNDNVYKDQEYESDRKPSSTKYQPNENRYSPNNDSPNLKYSNNEFRGPLKNYEAYQQSYLDADESRQQEQFSFLNAYIKKETGIISPEKNIFTDSTTINEEELPKPTNLRNDDHEISFTNDVLSVAKPSTSYKLENFADLPVMEYVNSKLHTVNSYSVPHYSVTSFNHRPTKQSSSILSSFTSSSVSNSNQNVPEVELAPPALISNDQSDAHLKAIKIWTHKSKGTAYTLHDDGTLTLEKPTRPKFKYN